MINKNDFLNRSSSALEEIYGIINALKAINIKDLEPNNTALIIVDMVNGFVREGMLKSSRIQEIIPKIINISKVCDELSITKIAFADSHTEASPEFQSYPSHCIRGTSEAEIVDEIKEVGGYKLIPKNSTNGFLEEEFQLWLKENDKINTFIITGDCTDICIQQFAVTLKTWFNMKDEKVRVIVPVNSVETYDLGAHYGDLMNIIALYSMIGNGIEVVGKIET